MTTILSTAFLISLMAATAGAQTAAAPSAPRVLSTVPNPPDGATPVPAQMSGMALQVGDLPPGIVVVRVIRGSFQNNVARQAVQLRVGTTDRVLEAATSDDGRAQFTGLAVGESVRVRTALDGELLESQSFIIPSQGGVRLVLVSGAGAGIVAAEPWPAASARGSVAANDVPAVAPAPAPPTPPAGRAPTAPETSLLTFAIFGAALCSAGAIVVFWPHLVRLKPAAARTPAAEAQAPAAEQTDDSSLARTPTRADVFEELVQLEKDHEEGHLAIDQYRVRRERLIGRLLSFDQPVRLPRSAKNDAA